MNGVRGNLEELFETAKAVVPPANDSRCDRTETPSESYKFKFKFKCTAVSCLRLVPILWD